MRRASLRGHIPEEALRSSVLQADYSGFEEDIKDSLAQGNLADIVVLLRGIMAVSEAEVARAEIEYTIVSGKVMIQPRVSQHDRA